MEAPPAGEKGSAPKSADFGILTIIPEAYDAVRQILGLDQYTTREGYQWAWGRVATSGRAVVVATGYPLDRENIAAATFTGALLSAWHPRDMLVVDIGGAVQERDDVQLGDVVTHVHLHYYDFYKDGEDGSESERHLPHASPSSHLRELSRRPGERGDLSWIEDIQAARPSPGTPKVLPGEMLVGGALLANSPRLHRLLLKHPKVLAVEMESVGAGRAVLDWGIQSQVPGFLVIRGMSDFCNVPAGENQQARDNWKVYAAHAAAAHALAIIKEAAPPPRRKKRLVAPPSTAASLTNLWSAPTADLVGRDRELRELKSTFSPRDASPALPRRHAIWGEAGVGKSSLASAFAEQADHYRIRWWIGAASEVLIRAGLRELARKIGLPSAEASGSSGELGEAEVHRYLSDLRDYFVNSTRPGETLIILDNVDDPIQKHNLPVSTLRYLPSEYCDVLITSQSGHWKPVVTSDTRLLGLRPRMGAELIARESGRIELINSNDVRAICAAFGGRPLFLRQIGALLSDGEDPALLSSQVSTQPEEVLESLPELEAFNSLWRNTYRIALEAAGRSRTIARSLIEAIAFYGAEPLPAPLVAAQANDCTAWTGAQVGAAARTLVDRSLIEQQGSGSESNFLLHRLIAAIVRILALEGGTFREAHAAAARAVMLATPGRDDLRRPQGHAVMSSLAPHIWSLVELTRKHKDKNLVAAAVARVAEASSVLGVYRRTVSEWKAAQDASEAALELSDPLTEPGATALRKARLANIMRQRGRFGEAESLIEESFPDLRRFGPASELAWGITVHARILRHRPVSAPLEALALLDEAKRILDENRPDDPATARQRSELHGYRSVINRQLSRLPEAEAEARQGLLVISGSTADQMLEIDTPIDEVLVATHLRALGGVWRLRGMFKEAFTAHRRALGIFERVYGGYHPDVCRALDSLGRVQREWGDFAGALQTFRRASEISEIQFGPGYAYAATAAVNTALVHLEAGSPREAKTEAELGFAIYRSVYHEPAEPAALKNDATVWALFVKAEALGAEGALDDAEELHQAILMWRRRRFGGGHAHVASSLYALAEIWRRNGSGEDPRVLEYHRAALRIRQTVFGDEPNFWLAQSQAKVGELTRDRSLLVRAHSCFKAQLIDGHWRTKAVAAELSHLEQ